jgi:hypothetical protein
MLAGILPPTGDGLTRVLFTRPGPNPQPDNPNARTSDLYVVSVGANGGPPSERLLAAAMPGVIAFPCAQGQSICFQSDARGRVFVTTALDPSTGQNVVERIDPVTGDRLDANNGGYYLSPSGRRLIVYKASDRLGSVAGFTLYEIDDRATVVDGTSSGVFIGEDEDVYYVTAQQELARIPPGGTPEVLATGVSAFSMLGPANTVLVLGRPTAADPTVSTLSVFDSATRQETPYPFGGVTPFVGSEVTASPDGRWLLDVAASSDFTAANFTLVDRVTGAEEVFQRPFSFVNFQWRPRRAELWIGSAQTDDPTIWIKTPGGAAIAISGSPFGLYEASNPSQPTSGFFTPDGAYWFDATVGSTGAFLDISVGSADDPAGPRFDLAPLNEILLNYWQLADGRILMPTYKKVATRSDIYAFDPATGDARLLGEAGGVTAVGQTRLLAILHVIDQAGDLNAIDLASSRSTVLAPEFTLSAFVAPQDGDRVAPGAHVAYQFQARFASPYDGIWVATVP